MVLVNLAGLHVPIQPAVDSLESNPELLGELWLAELVLEAIGDELINEIFGHVRYWYSITSYRVCQRESSKWATALEEHLERQGTLRPVFAFEELAK